MAKLKKTTSATEKNTRSTSCAPGWSSWTSFLQSDPYGMELHLSQDWADRIRIHWREHDGWS